MGFDIDLDLLCCSSRTYSASGKSERMLNLRPQHKPRYCNLKTKGATYTYI